MPQTLGCQSIQITLQSMSTPRKTSPEAPTSTSKLCQAYVKTKSSGKDSSIRKSSTRTFLLTQGNRYGNYLYNVLYWWITFDRRELVIEENIEGYIVVINVDGAEQPISLSVFTSAKAELTVATAAPNSKFKAGWVFFFQLLLVYFYFIIFCLHSDKVAKKNLTLAPYDAVIFYSGSGNVFLRFTLLIASLIVAYLS